MGGNFSINMSGSFPCLNPTVGGTLVAVNSKEEHWNSLTAFADPDVFGFPPGTINHVANIGQTTTKEATLGAAEFNFEVQECPAPNLNLSSVDKVAAICRTNQGALEVQCRAPYMDDAAVEECVDTSFVVSFVDAVQSPVGADFIFHKILRPRTPIPQCMLLVRNGTAACEPMERECVRLEGSQLSDCAGVHLDEATTDVRPCNEVQTSITIGTRDDVQFIANHAFLNYAGTITISGDFKSLTRIGYFAFAHADPDASGSNHRQFLTEQNSRSSIYFGRGSLPVLVEIRSLAFSRFPGVIQFIAPCPNLQSMGTRVFQLIGNPDYMRQFNSNASSVVQFENLESLEKFNVELFDEFRGTLKVTGSMPSLKSIERQAFAGTTSKSVVDIFNLFSLESIAAEAFTSSAALIRISGPTPRLTTIAFNAFHSLPSDKNEHNTKDGTVISTQSNLNISCVGDGFEMDIQSITKDLAHTLSNSAQYAQPVVCTCADWPCPCVLLIRNGAMVCDASGLETLGWWADQISDCGPGGVGCEKLDAPVHIGSRHNVNAIANFGFTNYAGTIQMSGEFKTLTVIGTFAFAHHDQTSTDNRHDFTTDLNKKSSLIFGKGSLPVLVQIAANAFSRFPGEIWFDSAFPKLELLGMRAFEFASHPSSMVKMEDMERLTKISRETWERFKGTVHVTGSMPMLQSIDWQAFAGTPSGSVVDIESLWSLESLDGEIFMKSYALIRMSGAAPRLTTVDPHAFRNAYSTVSNVHLTCVGEGFEIDLQSISDDLEHTATDLVHYQQPSVCTCEDWPCDYFAGISTSTTVPTVPCVLLVRNGLAVCEAMERGEYQLDDQDSDCYPGRLMNGTKCSNFTANIGIGSRDDLQYISNYALTNYAGTITISGVFKSLTTIGLYAFAHNAPYLLDHRQYITDQNTRSSIRFDQNSLPVLVEIRTGAFSRWPGEIQFLAPCPNIQFIGAYVFQLIKNPIYYTSDTPSVVRLENVKSLETLSYKLFNGFAGRVVVQGSMPSLLSIGSSAFRDTTSSNSVISIYDLRLLTTIGEDAFNGSQALIQLAGAAPSLIFVGSTAFRNVGNRFSEISLTCLSAKFNSNMTAIVNDLQDTKTDVGGMYLIGLLPIACACRPGDSDLQSTTPPVEDIATTPSSARPNNDTSKKKKDTAPASQKSIGVAPVAAPLTVIALLCIGIGAIIAARRKRRETEFAEMVKFREAAANASRQYARNYRNIRKHSDVTDTDMVVAVLVHPRALERLHQVGHGRRTIVFAGNVKSDAATLLGKECTPGPVAIKELELAQAVGVASTTAAMLFLEEALLLRTLDHPNCLRVVGIVSTTSPFTVLTEYCMNGSLKVFLRACRPALAKPRARLTPELLCQTAAKVTNGMVFLSSRSIVHRELAAHSVLVGDTINDIKISHFGRSKDVYLSDEYISTTLGTHSQVDFVRWMSPEAIRYQKFTSASDVWSISVLFYEIFSYVSFSRALSMCVIFELDASMVRVFDANVASIRSRHTCQLVWLPAIVLGARMYYVDLVIMPPRRRVHKSLTHTVLLLASSLCN
jgi:hypothetical protein